MRMTADEFRRHAEKGHRYAPRLARRVDGLAERDGDALVFDIARKLDAPHSWRLHFSQAHRATKWWEQTFETALQLRNGDPAFAAWRAGAARAKGRRRVTVIRVVASKREFIKDDDNLRFTVKPINDALRRLGLIEDDRRELLEQPLPEQRVSTDRSARTIVRIEPVTQEAQRL
jgi:hypothetical protein